jgi:transcriptional regulator with XRE-family HTH domain
VGRTIYRKDYKKVTEKLREARLEAGMSQVDVAKTINRPQSYISKVERGDQRIDVIELKILSKIYKKDVSYFLD